MKKLSSFKYQRGAAHLLIPIVVAILIVAGYLLWPKAKQFLSDYGVEVNKDFASEIDCTPRPACLDSMPACDIPEPEAGWCPMPTLTTGSKTTTGNRPQFFIYNLTEPVRNPIFWANDGIRYATTYTPNQKFQLCYVFVSSQGIKSNGCDVNGATDANGVWHLDSQVINLSIGKWTRWVTFANHISSNKINYSVVAAPTPTPAPSPIVTVTYPNGGEQWTPGAIYKVNWSAAGVNSANLFGVRLKKNGQIVDNATKIYPYSARGADYYVASTSFGNDFKLEVVLFYDLHMVDIIAKDQSDGNFSIGFPSP